MKTNFIILSLGLLVLGGCFETKTNKKSTKSTSTINATPIPGYTNSPYPTPIATGTPGFNRPPYTFSPVVAHGLENSTLNGSIVWSSEDVGVPGSVMKTDSRFDVRIKKESPPAKDTIDDNGVICHYVSFPYTKLKGYVRIKAAGSSAYKTMAFETNSSTGYSNILRFGDLADFPITSGHYVIEMITPIQSNGGCIREPGHPDVCPYWPVPRTECYSFSIELATDYTNPF
jgi:hypothetical protein